MTRIPRSSAPRRAGLASLALACGIHASTALAQVPQDANPEPDAEATMRFGPLALRPTVALTNMGVDTNVFNSSDNPQGDFTLTFTPTTNMWLRAGRTWITGSVDVSWVHYQTFASERSANSDYRVGVSRAFNRFSMAGNARHLSTRERPGFEIDARSRRVESELDGAAEYRVHSRTYVGTRAWRRPVTFDRDAIFRQASLADELNRVSSGQAVTVRHVATPLTTLSLHVGRERERFTYSAFRDSDSTRIAGTALFKPLALIAGSATIGYRHFTPLAADVPAYHGLTATLGLTYALLGTTRFGVDMYRDVQPSVEFDHPYYLETGFAATMQRQIAGPMDMLVRIGTRRLAYRDRAGVAAALAHRVDRAGVFTIGTGYRLGTDKRLGFSVDRHSRTSQMDIGQYDGLRIGMSLTYER